MSFAAFILQHDSDDPVRLLLARDKYPDIDIDLAVTTLEVRRKLRTKVPEWYAVPSLVYPFRLSGEQCSSSETARYKASLVLGLRLEGVPPQTVALRPLPPQAAGPSLLCGRGWPQVCVEFSKFACILSAAFSQHHLSGFEIAQLEFHHLQQLCS